MQQSQDFLDESEALAEIISPLSDAELERVTLFKAWTISDVVGHLHVWNRAAGLSLDGEDAFQAFYQPVAAHVAAGGNLNGFEKKELHDLQGRARVAAWRDTFVEVAARFSRADPSQRVVWAGPSMSARSSITARLMETWAHAQAVYDLLGVERVNTDRIRNIVILGVNTYGWAFAVHGQTAPEPMPYLRLEAPSGEIWEYGEPNPTERIEGSAEAFCQVVTQTRNIADTELEAHGPNAQAWMAHAQCFAGGPETPPAPGARVRQPAAR